MTRERKTRSSENAKARWLVSNELWSRFEQVLPVRVNTHPRGGGRPRVDDRTILNGIVFVLSTGCQWKALDATGICAGSTAHDRFQEWRAAGVFEKLWARGLQEYDKAKKLDWLWQSMDGAMTKARLGGGKNRSEPHRQSQAWRQEKPVV